MQNIDTRVRCHPFSNAPYVGCKHCCHEMTLVSALVHIFKCHTCLHRRDTPDGVTPIFPADKCADEHFANNPHYCMSYLYNCNISWHLV